MKTSLKLREERCPLLRAKLPLTVGGVPLSSGIAVGSSHDLAVHLGTFFQAGPSFKLAYKPFDPTSPFSLILKAGLGLWGSPNEAALAMTAEFYFAAKGGPFFSLRVKPRLGDFSLRREAKSFQIAQKKVLPLAPVDSKEGAALESHAPPSTKLQNGSILSPQSNGDAKAALHKGGSYPAEKEKNRSPSIDSNVVIGRSPSADSNVVIGSNYSLKIEGFDREWKGRGERRQKSDVLVKEQEVDPDAGLGGSGVIVDVPDDILQEQVRREQTRGQISTAAWPIGFDGCLQGWRMSAHSSLPLGKQAKLNIRWGVKVPSDLFQGWDSNLSSFSLSKFPSLLLDKISFQSVVVPTTVKPKEDVRHADTTGSLEHGLLPVGFIEESRELAQVAALCYAMKRQSHLLYAENKVLKRAMEEMKSQFEYRGSLGAWRSAGEILIEEETTPKPPPLLDGPPNSSNGRETIRKDAEIRKDWRDRPRKDAHTETKAANPDKVLSPVGTSDVSEELKKAIMSAKTSPSSGKNE